MNDESQEFLQNMPQLKPGEQFQFRCHPGVDCFNACCSDLNLMLTPYDALRLRRALGKSSREFVQAHCMVSAGQDLGFPLVQLRMLDDGRHSCPFVRPEGCSVYPNRPGACRTYPLGRASTLDDEGNLVEHFFIVQEPHCNGFKETGCWTSGEWLQDQGLEEYNQANDRYMRIMNRWKKKGHALDQRQVNMAFLALYQPDDFQRFIRDMKVFDHVQIDEARQRAVLEDEEAALAFGLDWLELILLGQSEGLEKR
ncbi:MAG: YkgJ family cysteine cluster protein [Desulfovibrio sp.]|nr:YkgJ family cysteine cluster protein [Desulfovibrio sp.]